MYSSEIGRIVKLQKQIFYKICNFYNIEYVLQTKKE